jgi:hypothetical protein
MCFEMKRYLKYFTSYKYKFYVNNSKKYTIIVTGKLLTERLTGDKTK